MQNSNSRRGFAAMDPEQRRRIAQKGGQHSHDQYYDNDNRHSRSDYEEEDDRDYDEDYGPSSQYEEDYDDYDQDQNYDNYSRSRHEEEDDRHDHRRDGNGTSRRGFASMPREEVRRIAAEGGRASHGGHGRNYDSGYDQDHRGRYSSGSGNNHSNENSRRGFASMPREEVRRIAAKGGHASHGGNGGSSRSGRSGYGGRNRSDNW